LFYKRINDVYVENVAALEKELGDAELARDPRMHDFVVPDECLWEKVARKTERELGTALEFDGQPLPRTVDAGTPAHNADCR
jgi:type I restriction enzyme M protein